MEKNIIVKLKRKVKTIVKLFMLDLLDDKPVKKEENGKHKKENLVLKEKNQSCRFEISQANDF